MNTQQKLADIYMLVQYIQEHVDTKAPEEESGRLDEIGKTTLEIAQMLKSVEAKTGPDANKLFLDYRATVDKATDSIQQQLMDVRRTLDKNTGLTKELYGKIDDIYANYTGVLESSATKLELQRENYTKDIETLIEEVKHLVITMQDVNEKTVTEEYLKELMDRLDGQLSEVIEKDTQWNASYDEKAAHLDKLVEDIQSSYQSLNETLVSVDASFKTAVSRLEVLLMQMNLLTEGRK